MQIRLNPVTLISGAGSGIGAACAHELARRSHGGLVLADADDNALGLLADELDANGASPERVSTLAFDAAAPERWAQAIAFVQSQYGRLDWAVVNPSPHAGQQASDSGLVEWGKAATAQLESAIRALNAIMAIMAKNTQGGAIVLTAPAAALRQEPAPADAAPGLLQVMRAAAQEGAHANVRINAIAPGGVKTPMWDAMPWFQDLVRETGGESAAFNKISQMSAPVARYAQAGDVTRLISMLLTDEAPVTGATLVVDGGYTL